MEEEEEILDKSAALITWTKREGGSRVTPSLSTEDGGRWLG